MSTEQNNNKKSLAVVKKLLTEKEKKVAKIEDRLEKLELEIVELRTIIRNEE